MSDDRASMGAIQFFWTRPRATHRAVTLPSIPFPTPRKQPVQTSAASVPVVTGKPAVGEGRMVRQADYSSAKKGVGT